MSLPRIKVARRTAVYHCVARVVGGEFLLDGVGKERFVGALRRQAAFSGVQIIAYCVMSNHVHVLARVPPPGSLSDAELLRRATALYGRKAPWLELERAAVARGDAMGEDVRLRLSRRMHDVSRFMQELLQRFARWHNKRHGRFGALWAERFRSVLVDDQPGVVSTVAAYIDLNPVRAGLARDPKDYRWCGYAEAAAGSVRARQSMRSFLNAGSWSKADSEYRSRLFTTAAVSGHSGKRALTRDEILKALESGRAIQTQHALRLRIRYFTDGLVLGSRDFVEGVFTEFRDRFGARRRRGAHRILRVPVGETHALRRLQKDVVA